MTPTTNNKTLNINQMPQWHRLWIRIYRVQTQNAQTQIRILTENEIPKTVIVQTEILNDMKTAKNILLIASLILASFTFTLASGPDSLSETCTTSALVHEIEQEVAFSSLAKDYGYDAEVEVTFEIDNESTIHVLSTESDSEVFKIHVTESLEGLQVHPSLRTECGVYSTTLTF